MLRNKQETAGRDERGRAAECEAPGLDCEARGVRHLQRAVYNTGGVPDSQGEAAQGEGGWGWGWGWSSSSPSSS